MEYDKDFNKIWSYPIKSPWDAIRLKNGNTLITDEQDSLTREVNPKGETVWEFNKRTCRKLIDSLFPAKLHAPRQRQHVFSASARRRRQRPAIGGSHAGEKNRMGAEEWNNLGDATAVQILAIRPFQLLDEPGVPETPAVMCQR